MRQPVEDSKRAPKENFDYFSVRSNARTPEIVRSFLQDHGRDAGSQQHGVRAVQKVIGIHNGHHNSRNHVFKQ
jgi:hypothetical protein